MCSAIESWRGRLTRSPRPEGQTGREAGIGAIRTGSTRKPDLLPSFVDLYIYLVTAPGDVVVELAEQLRVCLREEFAGGPLQDCAVAVELSTPQAAGVTPPDRRLVTTARAVWRRHHRADVPELSGWTGSTDGALLREAGVDTIRTGPASVTDDNDADWDALSVDELVRFSRIYAEIGASWAARESRGR
jgi:acetylornithine deacetylase/succinyl-diaminopimelate desuccinylase-like protein